MSCHIKNLDISNEETFILQPSIRLQQSICISILYKLDTSKILQVAFLCQGFWKHAIKKDNNNNNKILVSMNCHELSISIAMFPPGSICATCSPKPLPWGLPIAVHNYLERRGYETSMQLHMVCQESVRNPSWI